MEYFSNFMGQNALYATLQGPQFSIWFTWQKPNRPKRFFLAKSCNFFSVFPFWEASFLLPSSYKPKKKSIKRRVSVSSSTNLQFSHDSERRNHLRRRRIVIRWVEFVCGLNWLQQSASENTKWEKKKKERRRRMAIAAPGQLNLNESPSWGSRSVDCFEKLEQIGEGTYGSVSQFSLISLCLCVF